MQNIPNHIYRYCIVKAVLYSVSTFSIFIGLGQVFPLQLLAFVSTAIDLIAIIILVRFLFNVDTVEIMSAKFLLFISCLILFFYPITWDDLSYGLTLPRLYLAQNSFAPISEYGIFTFFPFVEYGRTIISFAFGEKPQIILYRIEGLALYLITFTALFQIGIYASIRTVNKEYLYFFTLLLMTTVSAFSVYSFVKPESFTTTCFTIAALTFLKKRSGKAIMCVLIAVPFKYTTFFTAMPILILGLSKVRHELMRIKILELIGFAAIVSITALWIFNNYLHTSSPFYPLLLSLFPYGGDGLLNGSEYRSVMNILLSQQDVSPKSIVSFKYLKYITTQLGGIILFLPLFLLLLLSKRCRGIVAQRAFLLSVFCSIAFIIFLLILFSEFRYVYALVSIIAMMVALMIYALIETYEYNKVTRFIIVLVCLQLSFVLARNYKNSVYDHNLSWIPINLSIEQREEISCIRSIANSNARTATFDQTFYFWKSPFFFIHELNEYIGIDPSQQDIQFAFQKFNVKFILLRDEYKDSLFLSNLTIGGVPREMPRRFLENMSKIYDLHEVEINSCVNTRIYELISKKD